MASEWKEATLGEQVRLQRGFDITKLTQRAGHIPVVSTAGVLSFHDTAMAKGPGVILGRKGNGIGRAHYILDDYWPHDTTLWVTDFKRNDPRFVFYFFRGQFDRLQSMDVGSANPPLNRNHVHALPVRWPPLPEQKRIAHILGTLDAKIELNRRMNATLEEMARALFKSWFVDFDPVRAKLDGRKPGGMDAATAALFPDKFQESEDGKLPVGWRYAGIAEVCSINSWTLGKSDDLDSLEYIEISEVNRGDIANIAFYQRGEEPSRARRRLRHGDTVLSTVRPDRGSYFLALNPPENRVASTGFAVLTPTKAPWSFVHAAMTQQELSDHLGQLADGGAYPAVRPEIVAAWQIVIPDRGSILDAFHHMAAPLLERAQASRLESQRLGTLRDTLLPKLLSGDLSVADCEHTFAEVA